MSNKENNTEQPITDISIYIAALQKTYALLSAMQVSISAIAVARRDWNSNGYSVNDKFYHDIHLLDVYLSGHFVVRRGVLYK